VLRTLRQHGVEVTALHSHMIEDTPHLYFMHFWANDDAQKLAHLPPRSEATRFLRKPDV